jgi:MoaA/NifB/PqqE/SkfB family radical SAM enzyme
LELTFAITGNRCSNLNTPRLIRQAKEYLIGTALSTSLSVQRFDAEAYVQSGLDFMVISIDGATQQIYERYRRNGNLELVFSNIRKLVEAKRKLRKRTPVLSWNFLAFEHNAREIPLAAKRARELGMNEFRVVEPFDVAWDDPAIRLTPAKGGVKRLTWLSSHSLAENWNPFPDSVPAEVMAQAFDRSWGDQVLDDRAQTRGHTCHWLYKNIIMDATGRIMPCCGAPAPDKDLVFASFDGADAFNSEKYRQARSWFATGEASEAAPYCTKCEWDHTTVNIGGPEIRRYFRAADSAFFDGRSLDLLSGW